MINCHEGSARGETRHPRSSIAAFDHTCSYISAKVFKSLGWRIAGVAWGAMQRPPSSASTQPRKTGRSVEVSGGTGRSLHGAPLQAAWELVGVWQSLIRMAVEPRAWLSWNLSSIAGFDFLWTIRRLYRTLVSKENERKLVHARLVAMVC